MLPDMMNGSDVDTLYDFIHDEPDALGVTFIVKWYDETVDQWYRNIEEYGITIDDIIANNDFYEDMIEFLSHEVEDSGYM